MKVKELIALLQLSYEDDEVFALHFDKNMAGNSTFPVTHLETWHDAEVEAVETWLILGPRKD
jgi:hypothetical protein